MCTAQDRKALRRVIKTALDISGAHLSIISDVDELRRGASAEHKGYKKTTPTEATACSPCCHLATDTEVSTVLGGGHVKLFCMLVLADVLQAM